MNNHPEPQLEAIAEPKSASNIIHMKERNQRILYAALGVGVILLVFGLISFLIQ